MRAAIVGGIIGVVGAVLAAIITVVFPDIWKPHDSVNCSALRSTDTARVSNVHFINYSKKKVTVYWVDYDGAERSYFSIDPKKTQQEQSYVGHSWCVLDADNGKPVAAVTLTSEDQDVVIPAGR